MQKLQRWVIRLFPYGRELEQRAFYDPLTRTLTRGRMIELVSTWLHSPSEVVLVYVDLDGLKEANDTCGHSWGDTELLYFAKWARFHLHQCAKGDKRFLLGRMGGDEFLFAFYKFSREEVLLFLSRLKQDMSGPVGFSFGLVDVGSEKVRDFDSLLQKADEIMYLQKREREKTRIRKNKR